MRTIEKSYKELMDLKGRKRGYYYVWLIEFDVLNKKFKQTSIKTGKTIEGNYYHN